MWTLIIILVTSIAILVGIMLALSPGKPEPFLAKIGKPLVGSISEKTFVDINGVEQGMFIRVKM